MGTVQSTEGRITEMSQKAKDSITFWKRTSFSATAW
jgi:hypothetical protein